GVGTARRASAVELGGLVVVGPDNGLLSWGIARLAELGHREVAATASTLRLGSGCRAVALDRPAFWRLPVSATFHGRDIFAPVAAHLAIGVPLDELGTHLREIVAIPWPEPRSAENDRVIAEVVYVDHFGNLVTSFAPGPAS